MSSTFRPLSRDIDAMILLTALAKKFRRKAIEVYGYEKGSVKVVLEDLIKRFVAIRGTEWRSMKGALKLKANSIELQHHAWIMPD